VVFMGAASTTTAGTKNIGQDHASGMGEGYAHAGAVRHGLPR